VTVIVQQQKHISTNSPKKEKTKINSSG